VNAVVIVLINATAVVSLVTAKYGWHKRYINL